MDSGKPLPLRFLEASLGVGAAVNLKGIDDAMAPKAGAKKAATKK